MSTTLPNFNYATAIGIQSLAGAIVFAILYVALLAFFSIKCFTLPTYIHYVLTFFCMLRVTAFIIRAVLAGSETAGENFGLVRADVVLSSVGYFSLLYPSQILVFHRAQLSDLRPDTHPIIKFTPIRGTFRMQLLVAIILGAVAGGENPSSPDASPSQMQGLRISSVAVFLFLTIAQAIQTVVLATSSRSIYEQSQYYTRSKDSLGIRYGNYILLTISLLLFTREIFSIVAAPDGNQHLQNNEHFWYPLISLPELLVVMLYVTPGLVPRKDEVVQYLEAQQVKATKATA